MFRVLPAVPAILLVLALSGCKRSVPDNVAATVNGRVITFADLDKQYQAQFMSAAERPSDDQMMIQKLEVLRTLVDNEIMLQRAEKLGLMATDADVEVEVRGAEGALHAGGISEAARGEEDVGGRHEGSAQAGPEHHQAVQ